MHTVTYDGQRIFRLDMPNVSAAQEPKPTNTGNAENWRRYLIECGGKGAPWWGVPGGYKEVLSIVKNGWPDGVKRLSEIVADMPPRATSIKRRRKWSDQGDELDIHRVYAGRLGDAWSGRGPIVKVGTRHVHLISDIAEQWRIPAEHLFWRGAAVARLSDVLSEAGYAVKITAAAYSHRAERSGDAHMLQTIAVKEFSEPLTLTSVAAVICLGGFWRGVCFHNLASIPTDMYGSFGTYPSNNGDVLREALQHEGVLGHDTFVVPREVCDKASAMAWISTVIHALEGDNALAAA